MRLLLAVAVAFPLAALSTLTPFPQMAFLAINNMIELTKYKVDGDRLYILGTINSKTPESVQQILSTHPEVKTLVLTAMPGSIDDEANIILARWLRKHEYNTYLTSRSVIASGAVDLFAAGKQRTIERGAKLGVHSWSSGLETADQISFSDPQHSLYTDYFSDILGSTEFYWFTINAAPADGIKWMTDIEIRQFELATDWEDRRETQPLMFGDGFEIERASILSN